MSVLSLLIRGLNFGIEFRGGTLLDLKLKQNPSIAEIRSELNQFGLGKSVIQSTAAKQVLIRSRSLSKNEQQDVVNAIDQKWEVVDRTIHNVGPGWGAFITQAALVALTLFVSYRTSYLHKRAF